MNANTSLLINGDDFSIKDAAIIGAAAALVAGIGVAIHKLRKNADEDDFEAEDDDLFDEDEPEEKISEPVKEEAAPAQDPAPINNEPEPVKFTVVDDNGNPVVQ